MSDIDRVLRRQCFVEDRDGNWYTNRYQHVRIDPDGRWQVLQLVAEGRSAEALRGEAHHPRWLDEEGFVIHPPPGITDEGGG